MESSRIFIRGLPPKIKEADLRKHFSSGDREVTDVRIIPDRRIGYVGFKSPEVANKAVKFFNKTYIRMSRLSVELAKPIDDPSLRKNKPGHSQSSAELPHDKTKLIRADEADADTQTKKRKRDDETSEKVLDPKLEEYLRTFEPTKSSANEVSEMMDTAALEEQKKLLKEDESDDEYETIPARPEKKQMREAPSAAEPSVADVTASKVPAAQTAPVSKGEDEDGSADAAAVPEKDTATAETAATDDDWLRSRTNRLLDLVDADDLPQKPPQPVHQEPANDTIRGGGDEEMVDQAESSGDQQPPTVETKAEEAPVPQEDNKEAGDEDASLATIRKTARLFIRNLPFASTEEDLRTHFEKYGEVQEVHIPVTADGSSKGYALALFANAEAAVNAFQASGPGATFQGRLLHVLPASARRDEALDEFELSKLPLAKQRMIRKKAEASKSFNWNALWMSQDAVNSSVANRLGVSKSDLFDVHDASAAVKQAVAETSVINETKEYFALHGVNLEAFKSQKRGDTVILVKNFPYGTTLEELRALFEQHGTVLQVLMPPSGTIAIVQFAQPSQGKTAFGRLGYSRFKDSVLFLEKGPKDLLSATDATVEKTQEQPRGVQKLSGTDLFGEQEDEAVETTSLFVKNLSFSTTVAGLTEAFKNLDGYRGCTLKTKPDPKKPGQTLSMGYGFVAFSSKPAAQAALKTMNGFVLDGHTLAVKVSSKGYDAAEERRREDKAKKSASQRTKLAVKNLGFEVSKKDLRALFSNYGQLRSCRIPQSMGGKSRGFGFVDFKSSHEAEKALLALKDSHLLGRRLVVDWADAEADDPEEELRKMEEKVRGQTAKVRRAELTNRTRRKVQIGNEAEDDI